MCSVVTKMCAMRICSCWSMMSCSRVLQRWLMLRAWEIPVSDVTAKISCERLRRVRSFLCCWWYGWWLNIVTLSSESLYYLRNVGGPLGLRPVKHNAYSPRLFSATYPDTRKMTALRHRYFLSLREITAVLMSTEKVASCSNGQLTLLPKHEIQVAFSPPARKVHLRKKKCCRLITALYSSIGFGNHLFIILALAFDECDSTIAAL